MAKELAKQNKTAAIDVKKMVTELAQRMPGGRFSNRFAVDSVAAAVMIQCQTNKTPEQKKLAAETAAMVALNSLTAGEEVSKMILEAARNGQNDE